MSNNNKRKTNNAKTQGKSSSLKKFKIPVTWGMWGIIEVEACTLKQAKRKVFEPGIGLPAGEYIEDSFVIDVEGIKIHNQDNLKV
jgi:hypothetical protein